MTFTPGPWHLITTERGGFQIAADENGSQMICARNDWDHRAAESLANARLIAAAPELLEALKRSREWAWEDFEGSIDQFEDHPQVKSIDAIIAKAEDRRHKAKTSG